METMAQLINVWELNRGDKLRLGDNLYLFVKMDGAYAKWTNEDGTGWHTFNTEPLFLNDNGYYEPIDDVHGESDIG